MQFFFRFSYKVALYVIVYTLIVEKDLKFYAIDKKICAYKK